MKMTLTKPIHVLLGKNPLHWARLFLLEILLNGGTFVNVWAWWAILMLVIYAGLGTVHIVTWLRD